MSDLTPRPEPAGLRLLSVHAHPDDESSKGAATLVRYARSGARVMVATCTGGERGEVLNPALSGDDTILPNLGRVRAEEMAAAAKILGIEHEWLGFEDSGYQDPAAGSADPPAGSFAALDLAVAAAPLVALVRRFRPQVMITYDERGGYPHPDHIRCHEISMQAYELAADPDHAPEVGPAWRVDKLYYDRGFNRARIVALDEAIRAAGGESPFGQWLDRVPDGAAPQVTAKIECAEFFEVRDQALLAHATQIDPNGWFFQVPLDLQRSTWPTEEYQLARTRLTWPQGLETDLFAGIEP